MNDQTRIAELEGAIRNVLLNLSKRTPLHMLSETVDIACRVLRAVLPSPDPIAALRYAQGEACGGCGTCLICTTLEALEGDAS